MELRSIRASLSLLLFEIRCSAIGARWFVGQVSRCSRASRSPFLSESPLSLLHNGTEPRSPEAQVHERYAAHVKFMLA
jgi:hypothetical protein